MLSSRGVGVAGGGTIVDPPPQQIGLALITRWGLAQQRYVKSHRGNGREAAIEPNRAEAKTAFELPQPEG